MTGRERERNLRRAIRLLLGQMEDGKPIDERDNDEWGKVMFIAASTLRVCETDIGLTPSLPRNIPLIRKSTS